MRVTTVNVVMFSVGAILLYSGVKAYDPRDVIKWGLGGKKPESFATKEDPMGDNKDNPDPGQRYPGDKGLPDENGPKVPATYPA